MSAYSREEIDDIKDGRDPEKGLFCPKCQNYIPVFSDLSEEAEARVRSLIISNRHSLAMVELKHATGCSVGWAKLWVSHSGRPNAEYPGPPCKFCGGLLRTSLSKQCPDCLMDWHDENEPKKLK